MTDNLPANIDGQGPIIPINLSDGDVIHDHRCKLCNSIYRDEAEAMFDKYRNYSKVHKLLEERGENVSYNAVQNHLKFHYVVNTNNAMMKEYAGEVLKWVEAGTTHTRALERNIAVMEREMISLAALSEGMNLDERRKNTELIKKLGDSAHIYRKTLMDIERSQEPVTLIFNQLQVIIQDELKNATDPATKTIVKKIITRLKDDMGDLTLE